MADEILKQDQYDQSGFLVGPRTEDDIDKAGREIDILRAIHDDTQESISLLSRIADGMGAQSFAPPPDASTPTLAAGDQERADRVQALHAVPVEPGAPVSAPIAPAADVTTTGPVPTPVIISDSDPELGTGQAMPMAPSVPQASASPAMVLMSPAPATPTAVMPALAPATSAPAVPGPPSATPVPASAKPVALTQAIPAEPRARGENGQFKAAVPLTVKPAIADEGVARAERAERTRQTNGRFGADGAGPADAGESKTSKAMGAASESLKNAAQGLSSSADNIDPTVQAAKEVGGIVSPVIGAVKPLAGLFGMRRSTPEEKSRRSNAMWFRRIWTTLKGEKGGGSGMGMVLAGLASMLGLLLAPIKALARMTGMMRAMAGLGSVLKGAAGLRGRGRADAPNRRAAAANAREGTGRRGKGAPVEPSAKTSRAGHPDAPGGKTPGPKDAASKTAAPGASSKAGTAKSEPAQAAAKAAGGTASKVKSVGGAVGGAAKGLLRKLPVIGALVGAGMFASAAMAKDDPNATPEEQQASKTERYGSMGGIAGGMLGGVLGMVGGPAGVIAGGMLGDQLGTAVGEWLSTVDMTGMMASITGAWQTVADGASQMASDAFGAVKDGWNSLVTIGTSAFTSMTDWAKDTWKSATEKVMAFKDTVDDKVQGAKDYVGEKATSVKDAGQNALNTVTGGRYTGGSNARKDELIKAMDAGGITDPKSKAALMANMDHESGGFTKSEENLNYSAKRLQEVFPKYYKDADSARVDANNPEAIANKVYGGRMGNVDPGDGYKFRGRGDTQLTGRDQYEKMGKKLGIDLVNNPELAADPKYSAQIAVANWKSSGADKLATAGDMTGARKRINGGTNGLADVNSKFDGYLAQAKTGDLTPTRRADQVQVAAPAAATGAIATTMAAVKGAAPASAVPGAAKVPGSPGTAGVGPGTVSGAPGAPGAASAPGGAGTAGVTPAAPKGQPLGMMPLANMAPTPPATVAAPAQATTVAPAAMQMANVAPVALPPVKMPTYAPPAADASMVKLPSTPQVAKPMLGGGSGKPAATPQAPMMLSQDLEDRRIAHAATGGLGGASMGRM
jgi:predicted chitinase